MFSYVSGRESEKNRQTCKKNLDIWPKFNIIISVNHRTMSTCPCTKSETACDAGEATPLRSTEELAAIFKALGSPVRLRLVERLAEGEQCVCVLHADCGAGMDLSTISNHLAVLRNSGVVCSEKRGKNIYYHLACPCLVTVLRCLRRQS